MRYVMHLTSVVLNIGYILSVALCVVICLNAHNVAAMTNEKYPYSQFYVHTHTIDTGQDTPIILWWSGRLFIGQGLMQLKCPKSTCYSTSNREYMSDPRTRGVYFYGTDIDPEDLPLPREANHEWALYHEESPMNNYMLVHEAMLNLFNHTATFRRESDYPLTLDAVPSSSYILNRQPVDIKIKNDLRRKGLALVLYVQSHCEVASDRDRYIKEFMKYVQVDSLGTCLHNKDLPTSLQDPVESMESKEFFDIIAQYKFHLAFENALCNDYMTEKLFRPLHVGSVPIYRGSPLARDWMPNDHSIILVDDFSSPKDLAQFIIELDQNDEAYMQYLNFKHYGIQNEFLAEQLQKRPWKNEDFGAPDAFVGFECHLCDKLTERHEQEKAHKIDTSVSLLAPKIVQASHLYCPQPYPSIGQVVDLPHYDSWLQQSWIEDYWGSLDKAEAISQIIRNGESDSSNFMYYWETMSMKNFYKVRPRP